MKSSTFTDEACKPQFHDGVATFKLSLLEQDMLRCGITRVLNKVTVIYSISLRENLGFNFKLF